VKSAGFNLAGAYPSSQKTPDLVVESKEAHESDTGEIKGMTFATGDLWFASGESFVLGGNKKRSQRHLTLSEQTQ
jgi:hypothetical protein